MEEENLLSAKLLQFVNVDLHDVKEARKRFDKASITYEQAWERFLSLKKNAKRDMAAIIEEELHTVRSLYEEARFNLIITISTVEAKKRSEFLEAVNSIIDAHLHYFKQVFVCLYLYVCVEILKNLLYLFALTSEQLGFLFRDMIYCIIWSIILSKFEHLLMSLFLVYPFDLLGNGNFFYPMVCPRYDNIVTKFCIIKKMHKNMQNNGLFNATSITSWNIIVQVLSYSQQPKESSKNELTTLQEKIQEYKRQNEQRSKQSPSGSRDLSHGDKLQSLARCTKPIEEVMQSSVNGKPHLLIYGNATNKFEVLSSFDLFDGFIFLSSFGDDLSVHFSAFGRGPFIVLSPCATTTIVLHLPHRMAIACTSFYQLSCQRDWYN